METGVVVPAGGGSGTRAVSAPREEPVAADPAAVSAASLKLLVVVSGRPDRAALRAELRERVTATMEVRLVASPSVSPLEWLTDDEDAARVEAQELASMAIDLMPGQPELEPELVASNTAQAIEDSLRTFAADQVLIVLAGEEAGPSLELTRQLTDRGLPVTTIQIPSTLEWEPSTYFSIHEHRPLPHTRRMELT
jgi:hypothetical protein